MAKLSKNELDEDFINYGLTRFLAVAEIASQQGFRAYPKDFQDVLRPLLFEKRIVKQELVDEVLKAINVRSLNLAHAGLRKSGVTML